MNSTIDVDQGRTTFVLSTRMVVSALVAFAVLTGGSAYQTYLNTDELRARANDVSKIDTIQQNVQSNTGIAVGIGREVGELTQTVGLQAQSLDNLARSIDAMVKQQALENQRQLEKDQRQWDRINSILDRGR